MVSTTIVSRAESLSIERADDTTDRRIDQRVLGGHVGARRLVVVGPHRPPHVVERTRQGVLLGRIEIEVEGRGDRRHEARVERRERSKALASEPLGEGIPPVETDHRRRQHIRAVVVHLQEEGPGSIPTFQVLDGTIGEVVDDVPIGDVGLDTVLYTRLS